MTHANVLYLKRVLAGEDVDTQNPCACRASPCEFYSYTLVLILIAYILITSYPYHRNSAQTPQLSPAYHVSLYLLRLVCVCVSMDHDIMS